MNKYYKKHRKKILANLVRKPFVKKKCKNCGKKFKTNRSNHNHCSKECFAISFKKKGYWEAYYKKHKRHLKKVSNDYYEEHREEILEKNSKKRILKPFVKKYCLNCGTGFITNTYTHIFCCRECEIELRLREGYFSTKMREHSKKIKSKK